MNLLLFEPSELDPSGRAVLTDERARHVREVLRAVPGQELRAGLVDGPLGVARVVEVHADRVVFDASTLASAPTPERPRLDLLLAMPRPKVFARLLPALGSLGVGHIYVSNAARVERYYFDSHRLEAAEIRRQLLDGLVQARDTRLPELTLHRSFRKLVEDELPAESRRVALDPDSAGRLHEACAGLGAGQRLLLAVGPEGGWVDFERALLAAAGFAFAGLGERVLRADVACLVALGLVHETLRDSPS
ncbi:MAG: 16S rRNA (uracil(1498)-N(3))-methyltransferase [Polyangiaceae bacterium]|nr:16S rRNA (uracil(1498)-N(3))-methyltransferase [Polyangiaceae bacterium]MCL4749384.1 16S rRNA (uracil(1498)-N(3))-methyltransferase [Myxococcales bacterium]